MSVIELTEYLDRAAAHRPDGDPRMAREQQSLSFSGWKACRSSSSSCFFSFCSCISRRKCFCGPSSTPPSCRRCRRSSFSPPDSPSSSAPARSIFASRRSSASPASSCHGLQGGSRLAGRDIPRRADSSGRLSADLVRWLGVLLALLRAFSSASSTAGWSPRSASRPSSPPLARSSSGTDGDRALRRQILRAARRRGEHGLGAASSAARLPARRSMGATAAHSVAVDGDHRRDHVVHLNRHRFGEHTLFIGDFERCLARRRHQCRPREDQAVHADGRPCGRCRDLSHAREQELFRQPGPGLPAHRHRLGADRRHLDLRRPRHHRRHGLRLLHHRHGRAGPGRDRSHRSLGQHGARPDLPGVDHLLSVRRGPAAAGRLFRADGGIQRFGRMRSAE